MKVMHKTKAIYFLTLFLLAIGTLFTLTACVPDIFGNGSYDMPIVKIDNPQLQNGNAFVDIYYEKRGCPPQTFQNADVEKSGSDIKVVIRYKDDNRISNVSTCVIYDEVRTVDLGQLSSGDYLIQARGQVQPSLTITVP